MKTLTILLASLLTFSTFANNTIQFVDKYRPERGIFKIFQVPMHFDTDSILRVKPKNLKIGEIYRIDYIATSYSNKLTDYQRYLNRKRWKTLGIYLGLDEKMKFEKHSYYQTKFENKAEAEKMFHGFMVYFRLPAEEAHKTSFGSSKTLIETICEREVDENTTQTFIRRAKRIDSVFTGDITRKRKREIERKLIKSGDYVIEWGYDSLGTDNKYHNSFYILTRVAPGIAAAFAKLADRSIFDFFKRNKVTERTMIVTDMTGSMYPYYSQLLVWHAFKMSQGEKMNHVFFNDGDQKETSEKEIGSTGGIYYNKANDILHVYKTMHSCMKGGSGGDFPENNFEAVKEGLKKYPKTDNVLMLCDNWAVPRDSSLLRTIKKPITFIMCGAEMGVNTKYVDLAAQNQGTLMTIENSISGLQEAQIGDVVKIGNSNFRKGKRKFQRMY
jgi:hypothetical protein